jgi:hypothetical protein
MAHFAQIDKNNIVVRIVVVDDRECFGPSGVEDEATGVKFCQNLFGGKWKQTSYNKNIRGEFAVVGGIYNEDADVFVMPSAMQSSGGKLPPKTEELQP